MRGEIQGEPSQQNRNADGKNDDNNIEVPNIKKRIMNDDKITSKIIDEEEVKKVI